MSTAATFGEYVKGLRDRQGLSQEALADRADLAYDTIRRLEHESFSPSLNTLRKLCRGLGISLSTLFTGYENTDAGRAHEILDRLASLTPEQRSSVEAMLRTLLGTLAEPPAPAPAPELADRTEGND